MSLSRILDALVPSGTASTRDLTRPRVVNTVIDGQVSPDRATALRESERRAIDLVARTHVERLEHFDVPRFS